VYIGKGLVSLTITYRDEYPPALPDDLQRIVMQVQPNAKAKPPADQPTPIEPEVSLAIP
jgi:hypothetical protein